MSQKDATDMCDGIIRDHDCLEHVRIIRRNISLIEKTFRCRVDVTPPDFLVHKHLFCAQRSKPPKNCNSLLFLIASVQRWTHP